MNKKSNTSNLRGGDCLILRASKQKFWIGYIDDKTVYLGTEHNSVHFPEKKLLRYFALQDKTTHKAKRELKK